MEKKTNAERQLVTNTAEPRVTAPRSGRKNVGPTSHDDDRLCRRHTDATAAVVAVMRRAGTAEGLSVQYREFVLSGGVCVCVCPWLDSMFSRSYRPDRVSQGIRHFVILCVLYPYSTGLTVERIPRANVSWQHASIRLKTTGIRVK